MFPDHLFRYVPEEFVSNPRTKPRETIKKENQNLPSREYHTTEKEKTTTMASKQVKLDYYNYHTMVNRQEALQKL